MDNLQFAIGIIGNVLGLCHLLAPMNTILRREGASRIPMIFLNYWLSMRYAQVLDVSLYSILVLTVNVFCILIGEPYVILFFYVSPKMEKKKEIMARFGSAVLIVYVTCMWISLSVFQGNGRKLFCGIAAIVSSIFVQGSQLKLMWLVIKTRSVESISFISSLFGFLNGASWFVFGFLEHDPFVAIPGGLGCGVGAVQLILYAIYRNSKCTLADESLEEQEKLCQPLPKSHDKDCV